MPCNNAAWNKLILEVTTPPGRPAGEGWKTASELAIEMGKARPTVEEIVRRWQREGAVETAYGTNDRNQRTMFVRPVALQVAARGAA